jgi:hypothetical protein
MGARQLPPPSVEPATGGGRIDASRARIRSPAELRDVPACVEQYVGDGAAHLGRGSQHAHVVPIYQHGTSTPEGAIHSSCQTRAKSLHTAPQRRRSVCLDDQVRVIGLQRIVHESEPASLTCSCETRLDFANEADPSQGRRSGHDPERHMTRMTSEKGTAFAMSDSSTRKPLATRARSPAAVCARCEERKFSLPGSTHFSVDYGDVFFECQRERSSTRTVRIA